MARIRSLKPEFWTDEIVVQLPFSARLLFIGLWNFADDHGGLQDSAERIQMQIFPGDATVDVAELLDLLVASNLLERWVTDEGRYALKVRNWLKHQRVDNPGKGRVIDDSYRKLAIPSEARRGVAIKYGCQPGERKDVTCFFCGLPGSVYWHRLANGKPSAWVTFPGMELDHGEPESQGGETTAKNLVLSCRPCNRSRGNRPGISFITRGMLSTPIETHGNPREDSAKPRGSSLGGEGIGGEGKRISKTGARAREDGFESESPPPDANDVVERVQRVYPAGTYRAASWLKAAHFVARLLDEGIGETELLDAATAYGIQQHAKGKTGTEFILSPAKFFESEWRGPFPIPPNKSEQRQDANVAAGLAFLQGETS